MTGHLDHAIVVAGHAVLKHFRDPLLDENWSLLDFQKGEGPCYAGHVRCGVETAAADPRSLLLFAGTQSRAEAGPRSEAQSCLWIAQHYEWFGAPEVAARAVTEEFSRDSFENLLFGICRFKEFTGAYPSRVSFVSWNFKEGRIELHREAIRWPKERFRYVGANNPPEIAQALAAEASTRASYIADPYSGTPALRAKRDSRNLFRLQHGYFTSCPELAGLFRHTGPQLYEGDLPWTI